MEYLYKSDREHAILSIRLNFTVFEGIFEGIFQPPDRNLNIPEYQIKISSFFLYIIFFI